MAAPSVGSVVLVRFPFSDLSDYKLRPAFVLASVGRGDFLLCQITSKRYRDSSAIPLSDADFKSGGLDRASFVRPEKLFTANESLIERSVGKIQVTYWRSIVESIEHLLHSAIPEK